MRLTLRSPRWPVQLAGVLLLLYFAGPGPALAQPGFRPDRFAAIAIEADSGRTLFSRSAAASRRPASLTKVMTLYVAFEAIERGQLSMKERIVVSPRAAAQPPTKVGLRAGSSLTVREAIDLIAVKSANDAAVALAEHIAGSETAFAARMNRAARTLGMRSSHFTNASGLPDRAQRTTARDLARLARAFIARHPDGYQVFDQEQVVFRGRRIRGHNRLLARAGVDGVKTGYTRASGFNLMSSGVEDGRRVIAVVLGGDTAAVRDAYMRKLLTKSFARLEPEPATETLQTAELRAPAPAPAEASDAGELWWVQVGAFSSQESAWAHLAELAQRHPKRFGDAPRGVDQPGALYQARFNLYSERSARETCALLQAEGEACFWFGPGAEGQTPPASAGTLAAAGGSAPRQAAASADGAQRSG